MIQPTVFWMMCGASWIIFGAFTHDFILAIEGAIVGGCAQTAHQMK